MPEVNYLPHLLHPVRRIGGRRFDLSRSIAVMGIVNVTPDSFYQRDMSPEAALARGLASLRSGADIIDVGGAPFAPGPAIDAAEEEARVTPVVRELVARGAVVSVDTYHASVARAAIKAGAGMINDTSGLWDHDLAPVIADHPEVQLVITHSLAATHGGGPRTQYARPCYRDVVSEVVDFLSESVDRARGLGVRGDQIVVDGGHDLNKNTADSLTLTRSYSMVAQLGHPLLSAVSRKDFVGEALNRAKPDRLAGSLTACVWTIVQGARIVRTHDVRHTKDAAAMGEAILGLRAPARAEHNMGERNVGDPALESVRHLTIGRTT